MEFNEKNCRDTREYKELAEAISVVVNNAPVTSKSPAQLHCGYKGPDSKYCKQDEMVFSFERGFGRQTENVQAYLEKLGIKGVTTNEHMMIIPVSQNPDLEKIIAVESVKIAIGKILKSAASSFPSLENTDIVAAATVGAMKETGLGFDAMVELFKSAVAEARKREGRGG